LLAATYNSLLTILNIATRKATFVAEPLERGFGLTLGNSLRRVLLSSLQGAELRRADVPRTPARSSLLDPGRGRSS
jgi:hypothetical protein